MSSKIHRCVGPPGCGKTTWVSRQAHAAAQKYGGGGVAIASLTRTAAQEVASRTQGVPRDQIGTLHSLAWHRLDRPAVCQDGKGIKAWNEACGVPGWRLSQISAANPENDLPDSYGSGDTGDEIFAEINVLRSRMVDQRVWPMRLQGFWRKWTAWKDENGYIDFTDMIEQAIDRVDTLGVAVFVLDEAQDMSRLEMTLAKQWGEAADQLVVVGDPDQNLYEWRGSEPEVFYEGEAASSRVLAQSYRVPKAVHEAAVAWIEQTPGRESVEYHPTDADGKVERHYQTCWEDAQGMATLVANLQEDGSSVMVLTSCGYMLTPLIAELKSRAIPFHNPYRLKQGSWNPLSPLRVERLMAFLRPFRDAWGDDARLWNWPEVNKWAEVLIAKGVMERGRKNWIKGKSQKGKFDVDEDLEVRSLADVLSCFEREHWDAITNGDTRWWLEHLMHQHKQRQRYIVEVAMRRGAHVLREQSKLTIGTVHSVKGGEADKVVLAPDLSRAGMEQWMSRPGSTYRLFYVGMTRARQELHVVGASGPDSVALL